MASTAEDIERVVDRYGDLLYRVCLVTLGSESDAEDAVQDALIRYMRKAPGFSNLEHEKAWLLKVAANRCRDMLRSRRRLVPMETADLSRYAEGPEEGGVLEALMALPEKYRLTLTLHYVEGYSVREIAGMVGRTESAVKMRLQKGRRLLKEAYGKECL